jgi:putative endonuclease
MPAYTVYILECSNGAYYTGYTTDLERRFQEHLQGTAKCKYTRSFPPVKVAASWEMGEDLSAALKLEKAIKALPKHKKLKLMQQGCYQEILS